MKPKCLGKNEIPRWSENQNPLFAEYADECLYRTDLAGPNGVHVHIWVPLGTCLERTRELIRAVAMVHDVVSWTWDFEPKNKGACVP